MKEAAIKQSLKELADTLASFDSGEPDKDGGMGVYESDAQAGDVGIDEYVGQLRLKVKYLMFDLEATRRENRYLRQMLDMSRRRKKDGEEGKDGQSGW